MKIHQLLMGRDVAKDRSDPVHQMAASMANFTYLVEYTPGKAFAVDAAWDVQGVLDFAKKNNLQVTSAIFTHRHLDHTGGRVRLRNNKVSVPGLAELAEAGIPVMVGHEDVEFTAKQTGIDANKIRVLKDGDEICPGARVLHTPGHTPGSICILLDDGDALITGDTLFIGSCGRTDLPESDPDLMMHSLARLSKLPQSCKVLPGHNYAVLVESTIEKERSMNFAMREAMAYVTSNPTSGLSMNSTSASSETVRSVVRSSSLPDYLEAARRALHEHQHEH